MKAVQRSLQNLTGGSSVGFKQMHIVFIINFKYVFVSSIRMGN